MTPRCCQVGPKIEDSHLASADTKEARLFVIAKGSGGSSSPQGFHCYLLGWRGSSTPPATVLSMASAGTMVAGGEGGAGDLITVGLW